MLPIPDDPAVLMEAAREALEPPGCVDVIAEVEQSAGFPWLMSTNRWQLSGRVEDGAWTELEWTPIGELDTRSQVNFNIGGRDIPFLPPLFGRLPEGGGLSDEAEGLLAGLTDMVQGEVTSEFAQVDEQELVLYKVFHKGRFRDNQGAVGFSRETLQPRWWTLVVEKPIDTDAVGKLTDMDLRLEVDEAGHFSAERFYGQGRWGVFRLRIERELRYQSVSECPSP